MYVWDTWVNGTISRPLLKCIEDGKKKIECKNKKKIIWEKK